MFDSMLESNVTPSHRTFDVVLGHYKVGQHVLLRFCGSSWSAIRWRALWCSPPASSRFCLTDLSRGRRLVRVACSSSACCHDLL
jgi:hypothetical protein